MTNELANVPELRFTGFEDKWEETNLGNIANIVGGGTPKTEIPEYWNGEINWYSPVEIGDRNYVYESKNKITQLGLKKSSAKILPIGTVLFTARAGIGNTAILKKEGATNQGFQSIIPKEGVLDTYFIFSRTNELKRYGEIHGAGSTFVEISGKEMAKMPISIPVIKEQQKIGDFFSKLDRQIELEEQKLSLLEEQKKGYMQQIFSQELRFKDENGNDYPECEEKKLKELIDVRDGTHESPKPSKEGYLLVTSKNLKNSKLDLSESYFISKEDYESINQRSKVEIGDILFGMIGTIGNPILLEECGFAIKNVALLKTNDLLEKYYILNFLKSSNISKQFYRMNAGGTQKFIALSTIRDLNIDMPSSEEAIKIGNFFNKVDNLIENQSNKLELLKKRKQGFLQKMFV